MKKALFFAVAILASLSLLLSACQPAAPAESAAAEEPAAAEPAAEEPAAEEMAEPSTVVVWLAPDEARWMMESDLPATFEEQNPQYALEIVEYPWDSMHDKVLAGFTGGELPDVFLGADHWVGEFAGLGGLEPMEGFMADMGYTEDEFLPNAWGHFRYTDGVVYAVPIVFEARGLFYRTDIFEEAGIAAPPTTLEEMKEIGLQLTNGEDQFGLGHQDSWLDFHFFSWLDYAYGGTLITEDASACALTEQASLDALNFYKGLYDSNIMPKAPEKRVETFQGFVDGYYAMAESGPWWLGLLASHPELEGKWSVVVVPSGATDISYGHPQPLIIPAGATNKAGAEAWIAFMLQPEIQAEWSTLSGQVPVRLAALEDERLASNEALQVLVASALKGTRSLHNVANAEAISEVVWNMLSAVRDDVSTPEQAAQDACTQINNLLGN